MARRFDSGVAMVTVAGCGIGAATARGIAPDGAVVTGAERGVDAGCPAL
jgi:NADP-dependent 3-hydroxy acid dehydrogenase YdfG